MSAEGRRKRQKTVEAGYGEAHRRLRRRWAREVATGTVVCARCELLIDPDEPWDLGHDDQDRSKYNGPEHRRCNRSAGWWKRRGWKSDPPEERPLVTSREW